MHPYRGSSLYVSALLTGFLVVQLFQLLLSFQKGKKPKEKKSDNREKVEKNGLWNQTNLDSNPETSLISSLFNSRQFI